MAYPMPTLISFWAASLVPPIPEAMIMAESGTAPSRGRTMPPVREGEGWEGKWENGEDKQREDREKWRGDGRGRESKQLRWG